MSYGFGALLFRQKYINRWSLMRCVREECLSVHSMETAVIAHLLATINRDIFGGDADPSLVAAYALYHDSSEVLCGDLPTPVKYYNEQMRSIYGQIEKNSAQLLLSKLPKELRESYKPLICEECDELTHRLVKTADKLCALIKCIEEEKGGNGEFSSAERSVRQSLEAYDSDELRYFNENFLPAFALDLDEL